MSTEDGRDEDDEHNEHNEQDKCATHDTAVSADEAADIGVNEQVNDTHVDLLVKNTAALMNAMHNRMHNTKPMGQRFANTLLKLALICDAWNRLTKCPVTTSRMKEIDALYSGMGIKNPLYVDQPKSVSMPVTVIELDTTSKPS